MSEHKLPMASDSAGTTAAADGTSMGGGPPPPPERPRASSARLIATLALAGAIAGFFIVLVYQWSQPRIEAHRAQVLAEAVQEVLDGPSATQTFFLVDGHFTDSPPASVDTASVDRVYVGYDEAGGPVGVAVSAAEAGFQDIIDLLFGYDPDSGEVLGMKVLESKETPGLGDKITRDSAFIGEFRDVEAPLKGVKEARKTGADDEVVMITGATISSRAVIDIINHRLEAVRDPLKDLWASGVPAPRAASASPATGAGSNGGER